MAENSSASWLNFDPKLPLKSVQMQSIKKSHPNNYHKNRRKKLPQKIATKIAQKWLKTGQNIGLKLQSSLNPIPTSQGRNQPLYERHVTKSGRNRVKWL